MTAAVPPFHPCGLGVDLLRSCYSTQMSFYVDDPVPTPVTWRFCAPGTKFLPFPTRFASGNWSNDRENWPGPGEILGAPRPWFNGGNPLGLPDGPLPCGTADQFLNGVYIGNALTVPFSPGASPCVKRCVIGGAPGELTFQANYHWLLQTTSVSGFPDNLFLGYWSFPGAPWSAPTVIPSPSWQWKWDGITAPTLIVTFPGPISFTYLPTFYAPPPQPGNLVATWNIANTGWPGAPAGDNCDIEMFFVPC